jgi:hypothetical protein
MYAAHKAAGGMTSVYRQIGIGAQWVFFQMLQDQLGLTAVQAGWKYTIASGKGKQRTLSLDGRIDVEDIRDSASKKRIKKWICDAEEAIGLPDERVRTLKASSSKPAKDTRAKTQNVRMPTSQMRRRPTPICTFLFYCSSRIKSTVM